jgi:diguanylate cyclase
MTSFANPKPPNSSRLSRRVYLPRVIGLALGGLCVGAAIPAEVQSAHWICLLLLTHVLLWPHLAYLRCSRSTKPRDAEKTNLLIDSLMGGFWVIAMQGNMLPSVLIVSMLSMNNAATGGIRFLSRGLLVQLIGALLAWAILGWQFRPESSFMVQLACVPLMTVYPIVIGMVTLRLAHQLNLQRTELHWLSENDALSGIYNRRYFEQRIAQEFENFKRHHSPISLIVADIDCFKKINDNYGHPVGDSVIRMVGKVFRQQVRLGDVAARIGGDEFVVLMPFTGTSEALELVQRLQRDFSQALAEDQRLLGTSLSFGIAAPQAGMISHENWMELADKALYRAKASKRGSVEVAGAESPQA